MSLIRAFSAETLCVTLDAQRATMVGEMALSIVSRINCPVCDALCIEQEIICWRCGTPLQMPAEEPSQEAESDNGAGQRDTGLIDFGGAASKEEPAGPRMAMTLTGERVELPGSASAVLEEEKTQRVAASIGDSIIEAGPKVQLMRLTFCKNCAYQNDENATECQKCKQPLEVVEADSIPEIVPVPRTLAFDALGSVWCALGFAAIYCGQFLIKTDPQHPGTTWADYFWTGIVACAPGILIFMRHYFCKLLFWVMTLGSILVWSVLGFIWLFIGLRVSPNGAVGLTWLALLSGLSIFSYFVVRQNDEFDYGQ